MAVTWKLCAQVRLLRLSKCSAEFWRKSQRVVGMAAVAAFTVVRMGTGLATVRIAIVGAWHPREIPQGVLRTPMPGTVAAMAVPVPVPVALAMAVAVVAVVSTVARKGIGLVTARTEAEKGALWEPPAARILAAVPMLLAVAPAGAVVVFTVVRTAIGLAIVRIAMDTVVVLVHMLRTAVAGIPICAPMQHRAPTLQMIDQSLALVTSRLGAVLAL